MTTEPQMEHQWLQKLIGEWTCEGEATMGEGKEPAHWKATESVRSIAGLWIVAESEGEMPGGGRSTAIMTLGYDPAKGRYVGTFVASMMTNMWVYDGALDAGGTVLALQTEGPSMVTPGQLAKYIDAIEVEDDNHRQMVSKMLGEDGTWRVVMTMKYTRKS